MEDACLSTIELDARVLVTPGHAKTRTYAIQNKRQRLGAARKRHRRRRGQCRRAGSRIAQLRQKAIPPQQGVGPDMRSEEHTYELQSLMRHSFVVFCLKNKTRQNKTQ